MGAPGMAAWDASWVAATDGGMMRAAFPGPCSCASEAAASGAPAAAWPAADTPERVTSPDAASVGSAAGTTTAGTMGATATPAADETPGVRPYHQSAAAPQATMAATAHTAGPEPTCLRGARSGDTSMRVVPRTSDAATAGAAWSLPRACARVSRSRSILLTTLMALPGSAGRRVFPTRRDWLAPA